MNSAKASLRFWRRRKKQVSLWRSSHFIPSVSRIPSLTRSTMGRRWRILQSSFVGVVFDFWQHWWEPDIEKALLVNGDAILDVHVADYKLETLHIPDRAMLGQGIIPLRTLMKTLQASGYHRWYGLEVISDDVEQIGYMRAIESQLAEFHEIRS